MTTGFAELALTLDELRTWLAAELTETADVFTDGAPMNPARSYVVLAVVSQPRSGAPWAGMTDAALSVLATSVGWDATRKRSAAKAARYLGAQVCHVFAATTPEGVPVVAHPALTGLGVLRRESLGDGAAEKVGDLWQWPETFRLDLTAA